MAKALQTKSAPTYDKKAAQRHLGDVQHIEGTTLTTALKEAAQAKSEGTVRLTVDVSPSLSQRFKKFSTDHQISKGAVVKALLEDFLTSKGY